MTNLVNHHVLMIFSFIFLIQITGFVFLVSFFKNFIKINNFFLNLSYSWFFGNCLISLIIYGLFFTNKLSFINLKNFQTFFLIIFFYFVFIVIKNKKDISSINKTNFFYLLLIIIFFLPLIIDSLTSFLISWDALAIWFLKAKSLFLKENIIEFLKDDNYYYSSQAYPIGFPLLVNAYYRIINQVNDQTIQFYLLWFYINMFLFIFGTFIKFIGKYLNKFILLITTFILLLPANFILYSHNGYVDLQLGYAFLIIYSLFYLYLTDLKKNKYLMQLLILGIGWCLTLKNESLPFCIIIFGLCIMFWFKRYSFLSFFYNNLLFLVNFLSFILWEIYKKLNTIPSFIEDNLLLKKENIYRVKIVYNYFILEFFNTEKYGLSLIICFFTIIFFISILLIHKNYKNQLIMLAILLWQLFFYFYVFLITPFPFIVQLEASIERIFLQFIPLIYFLTITTLSEGLIYLTKK